MKILTEPPFAHVENSLQVDREIVKLHQEYTRLYQFLKELLPAGEKKEQCILRLQESMHWAEKSIGSRWGSLND